MNISWAVSWELRQKAFLKSWSFVAYNIAYVSLFSDAYADFSFS